MLEKCWRWWPVCQEKVLWFRHRNWSQAHQSHPLDHCKSIIWESFILEAMSMPDLLQSQCRPNALPVTALIVDSCVGCSSSPDLGRLPTKRFLSLSNTSDSTVNVEVQRASTSHAPHPFRICHRWGAALNDAILSQDPANSIQQLMCLLGAEGFSAIQLRHETFALHNQTDVYKCNSRVLPASDLWAHGTACSDLNCVISSNSLACLNDYVLSSLERIVASQFDGGFTSHDQHEHLLS